MLTLTVLTALGYLPSAVSSQDIVAKYCKIFWVVANLKDFLEFSPPDPWGKDPI